MLTPLPTCSLPTATPRARSNERFHLPFIPNSRTGKSGQSSINTHVDAALILAGKTVTKSALITPRVESIRQRPGKSPMGGILPLQRPFSQPTPVVTLTFCSSDQLAIYAENKRMMVTSTLGVKGRREVEKWKVNWVKMTSHAICTSAAY